MGARPLRPRGWIQRSGRRGLAERAMRKDTLRKDTLRKGILHKPAGRAADRAGRSRTAGVALPVLRCRYGSPLRIAARDCRYGSPGWVALLDCRYRRAAPRTRPAVLRGAFPGSGAGQESSSTDRQWCNRPCVRCIDTSPQSVRTSRPGTEIVTPPARPGCRIPAFRLHTWMTVRAERRLRTHRRGREQPTP